MTRSSVPFSTSTILAAAVRDSLSTLQSAIRSVSRQFRISVLCPIQSWMAMDPVLAGSRPSLLETLEDRRMLSATPSWSTYSASAPAAKAPQAVMSVLAPVQMVGAVVTVDGTQSTVGDGSAITTDYVWNFGDPNGSYNTLDGYNASHVYNTPGTYTISLTLTNDLQKTSTVSTTITIGSDTRNVIYVDSVSGNDSNNGSSPSSAVQSAARADQLLGDNTEVLFKRGETFNMNSDFLTPYTNVVVGAYGSGALPVLNYVNGGANENVLDTETNLSVDVTFEDLSITAPSTIANTPYGLIDRGINIGVVGCTFNNMNYVVNDNGGGAGLLVQDSSSPSATGLWGYFVWCQSTDVSVFGNYVAGIGGQHVFRSEQGSGEMNIAYNNFTNNDGKGDIEIHWGQYAWVSHNVCNGGDVRVGPLAEWGESASSNTTDVVIEDNTIQNGSFLEAFPGSHDISIRGNFISGTTNPLIQLMSGDDQGRTSYDIQILNNTAIESGASGSFLYVEDHMSGLVLENNLYLAPNMIPGAYDTACVFVNDTDLSSFSEINGNVWQMPSEIYSYANNGQGINFVGTSYLSNGYLTPAQWNSEPEVGTDYFVATSYAMSSSSPVSIADGTASLNLSVPVPASNSFAASADGPIAGVFTDYDGNTYPTSGTWSAGAVQVGGSSSPSESINLNQTGDSTGSSGSSSSGSSSSSSSSSGSSTSGSSTSGTSSSGNSTSGSSTSGTSSSGNSSSSGDSSSGSDSDGSSDSSGGNSTSVSAPVSSLPTGWTSADIGSVAAAGSASYSNGTYTVTGSGADISGTADAFQYVYTTLNGNGTIVAQVSNETDVNSASKAGVMLRDGSGAGAEEVAISMAPDGSAHFDYRTSAGGQTQFSTVTGLTSSEWVELVRNGNVVSAYVSADGKTWQPAGSVTLPLDTTLQAGLAVTAHDDGQLESANFSNVSISSSTATPPGVSSSLPSGWSSVDIGDVGEAGSASYVNGTYAVSGSGADITGSADAFQYVYTTLSGDGTIVAQVSNLTDANVASKAGLMIRNTTDADSEEVSLSLAPDQSAHADSRVTTGGDTTYTWTPGLSSTEWIKLVRSGDTVTGYVSPDGQNWTQLTTITLPLDSTIDIGLDVSAHDNSAIETADFSDVSVSAS